jgi:hypothetical protein
VFERVAEGEYEEDAREFQEGEVQNMQRGSI